MNQNSNPKVVNNLLCVGFVFELSLHVLPDWHKVLWIDLKTTLIKALTLVMLPMCIMQAVFLNTGGAQRE